MPKIMEQMLMICALAVGVTATAVSCRDATEPGLQAPGIEVSLERRIADLQTQTEWMGKFHTDALTYIQSQLAAAKATARTAQERCRVASRAFKDFTRAFRKDGAPLTLPPDFDAGFGCDDGVPLGMRPTVLIAGSGGILPRRDDLSPQAQSYLSQIESAFDADVSLEQLESTVRAVTYEAAGTLDYLAATAVFGTASIAISSAEYWSTSSGGWSGDDGIPLATSIGISSPGTSSYVGTTPSAIRYVLSPTGRRIVKADVAAAVSSFLKDWWTGAASVEKAAIYGAAASAIAGVSLLF